MRRRRIPVPRGDYAATLSALKDLVSTFERDLGAMNSVGLGHPGSLSPTTGLVKNANSTWLNGQPLRDDLARMLQRPIQLANDADCSALSEATDGAAAGANAVLYHQSDPHGVREYDSTCKLAKDGDGWVFLKASHPDFEG